ncbi:PA domain-containing protein [Isoptericola jiangsuensis]|uniref:PA domain-containing protein n=1 Tax=Isoptericola jiangsuensis TaxID=548579 RepID=UPI000BF9EE0C|nr:PA domain-containing protein [Isoptericola jiangsuensis]
MHVVLDARDATPVRLDTPRPSVAQAGRVDWYHAPSGGIPFGMSTPVAPGAEAWVLPTGDVPDGPYYLTARWSRLAPLLEVRAHTPSSWTLDTVYQSRSTRLDGKVDLEVVAAGTGTPAEVAAVDAAGKALVVTRSATVTPLARAAAARDAGAALLVVVNDGPGTLFDLAGGTVPTVSVSAADGERLLSAGTASIRGTADAYPGYAYDYQRTWEGSAPADLVVAPRTGDLAVPPTGSRTPRRARSTSCATTARRSCSSASA